MFKNMSLKQKLIGSFCIMAVITCVVGWIGYQGLVGGSKSMNTVGNVRLPGLMALAKLQQGQTLIRYLNRSISNPAFPKDRQQQWPQEVEEALALIDQGWKGYDELPKTEKGTKLWAEFQVPFQNWKKHNDAFIQVAKTYIGTNDLKKTEQLIAEMDRIINGEYAAVGKTVRIAVEELVENNRTNTHNILESAQLVAARSKNIALITSVLGVIIALAFGIFLSLNLTNNLNRVITAISEGTEQVASASGQVASSSQSLAEGASEQAASVEETSSSLEEMASLIKQNADNARTAAELMSEAKRLVETAAVNANNMDKAMSEIKSSSDQTSKIVKTIDEIAFQTNLLALNAAVEAARAGEAGKGFAVVGEEVRNLAMRSAEAAKNTSTLIEDTVGRVTGGVQVVEGLKSALGEVTGSSAKVSGLVNEIAAASSEQAQGIEQVNVAVAQMDKVTQQNAANAEESASAAEEMTGQAESMREAVLDLVALVSGSNSHQTQAGSHSKAAHSYTKRSLPAATKSHVSRGIPPAKKEREPKHAIPLSKEEESEF